MQGALKNENISDGRAVFPCYWRDERFGIARRGAPVVGVSWYEASAYCRWLLRKWPELDEKDANRGCSPAELRLPLESEWQAAAGGIDPEKRYPWDAPGSHTSEKAEILQRANVEGGVGRTTPVGMYPQGLSEPFKLADLAGNVWEWQANLYEKDSSFLALRGGSWYGNIDLACVAFRYSGSPDGRWGSYYGFRVVVLPSK